MATTPFLLQQKIVAALAESSSASPVGVLALKKKLGDDAAEIDAAIESLCTGLVLARSVAHTFEGSVVSVWLTGNATPAGVAPLAADKQKPEPTKTKPAAKTIKAPRESIIQRVRDLVNAHPEGIGRADLILAIKGVSAVDNVLCLLSKQGEIHRPSRGIVAPGPGPSAEQETARASHPQPEVGNNTGSVTSVPTSAEGHAVIEKTAEGDVLSTPLSADDDLPQPLSFSLREDGQLTIIDDDLLLIVPPADVRRLGYFLGCFESAAWPPRLDPAPLLDRGSL